jgi:hypothetical protein
MAYTRLLAARLAEATDGIRWEGTIAIGCDGEDGQRSAVSVAGIHLEADRSESEREHARATPPSWP